MDPSQYTTHVDGRAAEFTGRHAPCNALLCTQTRGPKRNPPGVNCMPPLELGPGRAGHQPPVICLMNKMLASAKHLDTW